MFKPQKLSSYIYLSLLIVIFQLDNTVLGQSISRNSFGLSLSSTGLFDNNNSQKPTKVFSVIYDRRTKIKPLHIQTGFNYINYKRIEILNPGVAYDSDQSKRLMLFVMPMYKALVYKKHSFTLGFGPTISYQRNSELYNLTGHYTSDGALVSITSNIQKSHEWIIGLQAKASYTYCINYRYSASVQGVSIGNISTSKSLITIPGSINCVGIALNIDF